MAPKSTSVKSKAYRYGLPDPSAVNSFTIYCIPNVCQAFEKCGEYRDESWASTVEQHSFGGKTDMYMAFHQ